MANRLSLLCTLILPTAATHRLPLRPISAHTQSGNHVPLENHPLPREVSGYQQNLDWQQDLAVAPAGEEETSRPSKHLLTEHQLGTSFVSAVVG